jgi:hypothetical protein
MLKYINFRKTHKTRHHTQPRGYQRSFGLSSDYERPSKGIEPTPYTNPLQPRIKSGNDYSKNIDTLSPIHKESHEPYRTSVPNSTPARFDKHMSIRAKKYTSSMLTGASVLSPIPPVNKMQLQGYKIQRDPKYTSLAEVHQRGFMPRQHYMPNR